MIPFWKMHGAGNDFMIIDNRCSCITENHKSVVQSLCARHTGVGADGLLLIEKASAKDIVMRFFNPDGTEAAMCGNAARCLARLACDLKLCSSEVTLHTGSGPVPASVHPDGSVTLLMKSVCLVQQASLALDDGSHVDYAYVDTGVPHAVILVEELAESPVLKTGAKIRYHVNFHPHGVNVDFIHIEDAHHFSIRTYERGVEDETLACGTGIAAAAAAAVVKGCVEFPVAVTTAGGLTLHVNGTCEGNRIDRLQLTGPAKYVYKGIAFLPTDTLPAMLSS